MQIDQQRRDAVEAASAAWEGLKTARARVKAFNSQIEASKIALEGVEREAAVGSRTVLDVLDAEQELLDSGFRMCVPNVLKLLLLMIC